MSNVKRLGRVIKLKPEKADAYHALHADSNPGVRDLLQKYNIRNFSIFERKLDDGSIYLFSYGEYIGNDYEADMAALAAEPRNKQWQELCRPCQEPLDGESLWALMDQVYFND